MFSLTDTDTHTLYESNVYLCDMEEKYPDKYLIVTNTKSLNGRLHGDIIAIMTPVEYAGFKKQHPEPILPKFGVVVGLAIKMGGLGVYGLYL